MYHNQSLKTNRAATDLAMAACAMLQAGGFQILSAHVINNEARIIVSSKRQRHAFELGATRSDIEWRV